MRDAFVEELILLAEHDPDLHLITGDLGFGIFEDFEERFPNQFLNVGVAEQNMMMVAAGMALEGKKVFTYSIGNFPTLRCLEQIRNDVCYHDLNVTIIGSGGGFSYGQLGMSHHATEDLSIMRALPNMVVVAPSSVAEVKGAMRALYKISGPSYMRLDKSKFDSDFKCDYHLGMSVNVRDGEDVTLVACGGILSEIVKASDLLKHKGIECRVISMHTIKPIDKEAIKIASQETNGIVTIEENNILGGLGSAVAEICLENDIRPGFFKRVGLNDCFSSVVGDQFYLRDHYKMASEQIIQIVEGLLRDRSSRE
jgi:transketolase